ncbi:hypothetical protein EPUL_004323, partial [Erysiphe pulchra]
IEIRTQSNLTISNIDCTVSSFKDGDEQNMAKSIQAYLRAAISKFAASNTTPLLPEKQLKSNTVKVSENPKTHLPNKPLVTSFPSKLSIGQVENETNPIKDFISQNPSGLASQALKNPVQTTLKGNNTAPVKNKNSSRNLQDNRLFFRLPVEHEWRNLSPTGIREIVVKRLSISPAQIGTFKPVRSGFAISSRNNNTREELLKAAVRLSSSGAKLEAASNWTSVIIPTVPNSICTEKGQVEITKEMLANEIERVTLMRPASLRLYGRNLPNAPHRICMAYFTEAPRPGFRVFDESGIMRKCLARPTRNGQPTKEQLKTFQKVDEREFQALARAKAAEPLISWTLPPRSVATGDFNSVHWAWQTGAARSYGQGEENNMSCLIKGEPTHRAGNTLDLAWSNIIGASAWVERDECMTSDHFPIRPTQDPERTAPSICIYRFSMDPTFNSVVFDREIDNAAAEICDVLKETITAVGKRPKRGNGKSPPWWISECMAAQIIYRSTVTEPERSLQAKVCRKVVAAAKREFWKRQVEGMKFPKQIFKLMRWVNQRHNNLTSPLLHEGQFISNQNERACVHGDALLARHQASDDLPP